MRVALYWAPEPDDPLTHAGNAWLGRDAESGAAVEQPDLPGIAEITASPRAYGLHATLRPPMRLATGWEEFIAAATALAQCTAPFDLPALHVTDMDGFLALGLAEPSAAMHALADSCVRDTDPHRLQPDAAELARRRAASLSPLHDALLLRWGYPYVMEAWRFHMTLTRRLTPPEMALVRPAAEAHFAPSLARPRRVSSITIFTQRGNAPFLIAERLPLAHHPASQFEPQTER